MSVCVCVSSGSLTTFLPLSFIDQLLGVQMCWMDFLELIGSLDWKIFVDMAEKHSVLLTVFFQISPHSNKPHTKSDKCCVERA